MGGDELNKMREKLKYFQKCLADTELKLSDAYKEISDLRMQFSFDSEVFMWNECVFLSPLMRKVFFHPLTYLFICQSHICFLIIVEKQLN